MSSSPENSWVLSVPFSVAPALLLEEKSSESLDGVQLTLGPGGYGYNHFLIEGLASIEHVRDMFSKLKTGALAAGLYAGCGVRITDDLVELDDSTPPPSDPDRPTAYRHGQDVHRILIHYGEPSFVVPKVLPRFMAGLRAGLTIDPVSRAMQDRQIQLAGVLYSESHFETSPQARFIGLIGVLEVLRDKEHVSIAAQELINRWMDEVRQARPPEEQSLQGQLGRLKIVSVSQGIRTLTQRHLGDEAARTATKLYTCRSQLVHDGVTPTDLRRTLEQAEGLVRQLLAKILSAGTR